MLWVVLTKTLRGNLLRINIFNIFQTFWGMGGTGNSDRQGVVQIGKPIEIKGLSDDVDRW